MPEASASDIGVSLIKTRLEQKSYDAPPSLKPATGTQNSRFGEWVGREVLFERERGGDPDFRGWDGCLRACAGAGRILTQKLKTASLPKECRPLTFHTADSL